MRAEGDDNFCDAKKKKFVAIAFFFFLLQQNKEKKAKAKRRLTLKLGNASHIGNPLRSSSGDGDPLRSCRL
jgi:hypothetical protein